MQTKKAYIIDLINQKIRLLNTIAKFSKGISALFERNFIYLSLEEKKSKALQTNLKDFVTIVSYCYLSLSIDIKIGLLNLEYK